MKHCTLAGLSLICLLLAACSTAPKQEGEREDLLRKADQTVLKFKEADPTIADALNRAHGYAVFPTVGKGGAGVGGAYGRGVVYEQGRPIGFCDLSQASIGLQLGGQKYNELILFEKRLRSIASSPANTHWPPKLRLWLRRRAPEPMLDTRMASWSSPLARRG